jgi:hypothetical protein
MKIEAESNANIILSHRTGTYFAFFCAKEVVIMVAIIMGRITGK